MALLALMAFRRAALRRSRLPSKTPTSTSMLRPALLARHAWSGSFCEVKARLGTFMTSLMNKLGSMKKLIKELSTKYAQDADAKKMLG